MEETDSSVCTILFLLSSIILYSLYSKHHSEDYQGPEYVKWPLGEGGMSHPPVVPVNLFGHL